MAERKARAELAVEDRAAVSVAEETSVAARAREEEKATVVIQPCSQKVRGRVESVKI